MKNLPVWAKNLKAARKAKGMKQTHISAKIYKCRSVYGLYERGKVEPSQDTWLMLCDILEIEDLKTFWKCELFSQNSSAC